MVSEDDVATAGAGVVGACHVACEHVVVVFIHGFGVVCV